MNLLLYTDVAQMLSADSTGLAILLILALGTFVAGVHTLSWQTGVLGVVEALAVPAIAWIEESALLLVIAAFAFIALVAISGGSGGVVVRLRFRSKGKRLHPDQGGTTFLASRVNEAKDMLIQPIKLWQFATASSADIGTASVATNRFLFPPGPRCSACPRCGCLWAQQLRNSGCQS